MRLSKVSCIQRFTENIGRFEVNLEREIKKISKHVLNSTFLNLEKRCELIISARTSCRIF